MLGRVEKKLVKTEIKDVTLPPMDALNEGDMLVVAFEQGKEFQTSQDFALDWLPGSGDMGARVNSSLSAVLTFHNKSGKYADCLLELSIRKRKKGAPGKQKGPNAFKKLAWANIELHKFANKTAQQSMDLALYYEDEGEELYGKGAAIKLTLSIQSLMTDENGNEVSVPSSKTTAATRNIEATKSDLAETGDLLRARGEKISKLAVDSDQLMSDANDYSRMARQLAGGGRSTASTTVKRDHAAEIAARHEGSGFKEKMKQVHSGTAGVDSSATKVSPSGKSSGSAAGGTSKFKTAATAAVATSSAARNGGSSNNKARSTSSNNDDLDDEELQQDQDDFNVDAALDNLRIDDDSSEDPTPRTTNSAAAVSASSRKPTAATNSRPVNDGTLGDDSDDESAHRHNLFGGLSKAKDVLDPRNALSNLKSGLEQGKRAVTKGGHAIMETGHNIVQSGVYTVGSTVHKGRQGIGKMSHTLVDGVVDGVKKVGHTVGLTGSDDEHDTDNDGDSSSDAPAANAGSLVDRFAEIAKASAEFANVEFPKAEMDASNTTEDLKVLELLEAARLENLTLREKAIQFEFQMAKYNFFVTEHGRLQTELETARAQLAKVDAEYNAMSQRLEAKSTEGASLLQELEIMKSKVALAMADTARYKEEERLLTERIATLKGNRVSDIHLNNYNASYANTNNYSIPSGSSGGGNGSGRSGAGGSGGNRNIDRSGGGNDNYGNRNKNRGNDGDDYDDSDRSRSGGGGSGKGNSNRGRDGGSSGGGGGAQRQPQQAKPNNGTRPKQAQQATQNKDDDCVIM